MLFLRSNKAVEAASVVQPIESASSEAAKDKCQLEQPIELSNRDAEVTSSSVRNRISEVKNVCSSVVKSVYEPMLNLGLNELRKSVDCIQQSLNQIQGLFYPNLDLHF